MNFANPTGLKVGATGALHTWRVRVAGRLVLGVEIDGETYYWQEFHLVGDNGSTGTLVFEEGDAGPEWKLFRMFEPTQPLSAREAAAKKVGDTVNLDGTPTRITLVDQSRVYHIEGEPPEGVEVGDVSSYFNADTGRRMLVASWSGDEIEFYEGEDIPGTMVAKSFGLAETSVAPKSAAAAVRGAGEGGSRGMLRNLIFVVIALALITIVATFSCSRSSSQRAASSAPPSREPAPALQLRTGASGQLGRGTYSITGSSVVELARVSGRRAVREYQLTGEGAGPQILLQGLLNNSLDWHLLTSVKPPESLTPYEAAALRKNGWVSLGSEAAQVMDLFRAQTLSREATADMFPDSGAVRYGFVARTASEVLVARWDETGVQLLRGVACAERDVIAAFITPAKP